MITTNGQKISLEKFNEIMNEHSESKRGGYDLKKTNFDHICVSKFETPLNLYTLGTQTHIEYYEWGKKISNHTAAVNSNIKYTDFKMAFANPYTEDQVFNRKEKNKVDQEIKKVSYESLYNSIDYSENKKENKYIEKMTQKEQLNLLKRIKNQRKQAKKDEELFNTLTEKLNLRK